MNWKGFGRKPSLCNEGTVLEFDWKVLRKIANNIRMQPG
jgi:hypothetical protein